MHETLKFFHGETEKLKVVVNEQIHTAGQLHEQSNLKDKTYAADDASEAGKRAAEMIPRLDVLADDIAKGSFSETEFEALKNELQKNAKLIERVEAAVASEP